MLPPLIPVARVELIDAHWIRLLLDCGHTAQRRRKFRTPRFDGELREDPFPQMVRCEECGGARTVDTQDR